MRLPRIIEFYGKNTEQMPKLLKKGKVPVCTAGIMQYRLEAKNDPGLWNHSVQGSDLIIYPKEDSKNLYVLLTVDNQNKITPNGKNALELIKPGNIDCYGGAVLEAFGKLEGDGLIKIPKNRITAMKPLFQDHVLKEQLWRILARDPDEVPAEFAEDKDLLKRYFKEVASKTNTPNIMPIYFDFEGYKDLRKRTSLKLLSLGHEYSFSYVTGRDFVDHDSGSIWAI